MNFSIPAAGLQSASDALEAAAAGIAQAFQGASDPTTNGSTLGDSISLSAQMVSLIKSSLDFSANIKVELVDNSINQSTLSMVG